MHKKNKCHECVWLKECGKELNKKCKETDYIFFATKEDKKLCDMMCGKPEKY